MLKLPTILIGYIHDVIRLEALDGEIRYHFPLGGWLFNKPPFEFDGKKFVVTHLQKKSKFGFLLTCPFGFHVWYQFKEQAMDEHDEWIPGSEVVFYGRLPGYR